MVPLDTDMVAAMAAASTRPRTPTGRNVDTPTTNAFCGSSRWGSSTATLMPMTTVASAYRML